MTQLEHQEAAAGAGRIAAAIESVMAGQSHSIRLILAAFPAGGHVLIEDNPGTGKTTLAKALALAVGGDFKRVPFTSDLLPSDIVGVSVFNPREQSFDFHAGPSERTIEVADFAVHGNPVLSPPAGAMRIEGSAISLRANNLGADGRPGAARPGTCAHGLHGRVVATALSLRALATG